MEYKKLKALVDQGSLEYSQYLEQAALALGLAVEREDSILVLKTPIELLLPEQIKSRVTRDLKLEVLWNVDSTNTYLMNKANEHLSGYRVCLAEQQESGRGRRGRTWISPFGSNLYLSIARKFPKIGSGLGGLSLVVGMQVAKALKLNGVDDVGLKWPNDIILYQGKVAGILVEVGPTVDDNSYVVVGIGINTRLTQEDGLRIDQPHSTLEGIVDLSRNDLAGDIVENVTLGLERFAQCGFAPFVEEWSEYNLFSGKQVTVHLGDKIIEGIDAGIDESGNLRLQTDDGTRTFNSGEISLRGMP
tara:strand:+ start:149 stop:1057 length:909 start_codon:yes stop_codon:yes gene_type:complete